MVDHSPQKLLLIRQDGIQGTTILGKLEKLKLMEGTPKHTIFIERPPPLHLKWLIKLFMS
jgi:hypothetical protein